MTHDLPSQQPILIITGMHRSGTSLTSALLQSAGLDIGQDLLKSNPWNPKGFFENINFLNFHEAALQALGFCREGWVKETIDSLPEYFVDQAKDLVRNNASVTQPWGWKEPRTTLFLKFWDFLLPEAKYLFVYRSPWEVLDSLYRRGDLAFEHNPEFALKVWTTYNQAISDYYHSAPEKCFLTHVNGITQDPDQFIICLREKLNLLLDSPRTEIYEKSLLHLESSNSHRPSIIKNFFPEAFELYSNLNSFADLPDQKPIHLQAATNTWLLQDWLDLRRQNLTHQQELENSLQKSREDFRLQLEQITHEKDTSIAQLQQQKNSLEDKIFHLQQMVVDLQSSLEESCSKLGDYIESNKIQAEKIHAQEMTIQHFGAELEQISSHREDCAKELEIYRFRSNRFQTKLQQSNRKKREIREEMERLQAEIAAMKTSKFWKLRTQWFRLKRIFGFQHE